MKRKLFIVSMIFCIMAIGFFVLPTYGEQWIWKPKIEKDSNRCPWCQKGGRAVVLSYDENEKINGCLVIYNEKSVAEHYKRYVVIDYDRWYVEVDGEQISIKVLLEVSGFIQ